MSRFPTRIHLKNKHFQLLHVRNESGIGYNRLISARIMGISSLPTNTRLKVPLEVTQTKYELYRSKTKVVGSIQAMSSEKPGVQTAYRGGPQSSPPKTSTHPELSVHRSRALKKDTNHSLLYFVSFVCFHCVLFVF